MKILVFDPGENTGWVAANVSCNGESDIIAAGTAVRNHLNIADLFNTYEPDIVVFERFNLYPGMAKTLSWNTFYPCEVIGVIRYLCDKYQIPYYEQAPSIKKYAGGLQQDWVELRRKFAVTEHSKDAYLHLKYFLRNHKEKLLVK